MSCGRCGLDDLDCQCHVWELVKRVDTLENQLFELTNQILELTNLTTDIAKELERK